jgi:AcrR family transcriptional regulator
MTQPVRRAPPLAAKKQPAQQRATETYERILEVTAQTLADVGIERLSTNLVCERAGLTPPALYRYFPNKYALLSELGQRLMQHQNAVVAHWITRAALDGPLDGLERALEGLIVDTYEVTKTPRAGCGSCGPCAPSRRCRKCGWPPTARWRRSRPGCWPRPCPRPRWPSSRWSAAPWWNSSTPPSR